MVVFIEDYVGIFLSFYFEHEVPHAGNVIHNLVIVVIFLCMERGQSRWMEDRGIMSIRSGILKTMRGKQFEEELINT